MTHKFLRISALVANLLVIGAAAVAFVHLGTAAESSARVRNSLIADTGAAADLIWTPDEVPATFQLEKLDAPGRLVEAVHELPLENEKSAQNILSKSKSIAKHMIKNQSHGGPIRSDTLTAYDEITSQGRGYCADYSQVFSALAIAAGIPVREWGMGFEGFGFGHTVNDVFDDTLGKWVLIDSFHSLYVVDATTGLPLSVLEFQEKLRSGRANKDVKVVPISEEKFAFRSQNQAISYYERGADQMYLFWGNNVFSYDQNPLIQRLGSMSRALEVAGAIITGIQPAIRIPKTSTNSRHIEILKNTRVKFMTLFFTLLIAVVVLVYQIWAYRRAAIAAR